MAHNPVDDNQVAALEHHNDEESKEDLSMVLTYEASQTTEPAQFSHLFPAHLYIKKRTGG